MNAQLHSPPLAFRRRFVPFLVAVAASSALLGCGSDSSERELEGEPFSEQESLDLVENLDEIQVLVEEGNCEDADNKLASVTELAENVPAERDEQLKADLLTLLGDLDEKIGTECTETEATTSSTSTQEDTATTETTETTETTTTTTDTSSDEEEGEDAETTAPEEPEVPPVTPPETPVGPPEGVGPSDGGIGPGDFEAERRGIGSR